MKICPQCKNENPDIANFCRFCGTDLRSISLDWNSDFNETNFVKDDIEDKTQLLYDNHPDDYYADNEAIIRQRRAEEERRVRERRRRFVRDYENDTEKTVSEEEYRPSEDYNSEPSFSGGGWNSEWMEQKTEEKISSDKKTSFIRIALFGIASLTVFVFAMALLMKHRGNTEKTNQITEKSITGTNQVVTGSTNEGGDITGVNEGDKVETNSVQFSQVDFDSGNYATVVTLKSLQLEGLVLYSEPDGLSFDTIPEAVPCALLDRKSIGGITWDYVSFCGKSGWVKDQYIRNVSDGIEYFHVSDRHDNTVFVTKPKIKIHSKPESTASTVIAENIPYGTEFRIDALDNGWGHSYFRNEECWIDMDVMGFYSSLTWQIERGDGKTEGINLRKEPSEESPKLTKIPIRTRITEIEHRNGWAKVYYDGKSGWVKLHYATPCGNNGLDYSEG